jgi:hypothetical protein
MNMQLDPTPTCQSPSPWHPKLDLVALQGATDVRALLGARSVLVSLATDLGSELVYHPFLHVGDRVAAIRPAEHLLKGRGTGELESPPHARGCGNYYSF